MLVWKQPAFAHLSRDGALMDEREVQGWRQGGKETRLLAFPELQCRKTMGCLDGRPCCMRKSYEGLGQECQRAAELSASSQEQHRSSTHGEVIVDADQPCQFNA